METKSIWGIDFILIPRGEGIVGRLPFDELGRNNELDCRKEFFNEFYISKFPIIQKQYNNILGFNPSYYKIDDGINYADLLPVECVSWYDAIQFCEKLQKIGKIDNYKIRLPTESEWEYACRGADKYIFQNGNSLDSSKGNIQGKYPYGSDLIGPTLNRTCEVGRYEPNQFGLYDMHGNVWEWCMDVYKSPAGLIYPNARVLKGGAWNCYSRFCRTSYRCINEANKRYFDTGFRVVISKDR